MFQSIGERLNKFSSVVIRNVKKLLNCKDVQVKKLQTPLVLYTDVELDPNGARNLNSRTIDVARKKEERILPSGVEPFSF